MAVDPALNNLNVDGVPPHGGMPVLDRVVVRPERGDPALNNVNVDGVPLPEERSEDGDYDLFMKLSDWYRIDRDHSAPWQEEARECYDVVANKQWSDTDAAALKDLNRVPVTWNRVMPMVKTVCGLETGNRQEVRYIPRQLGDSGVNELLTEAAKWARDQCNAEHEESDAFGDLVICGMGWCETAIDYDDDPDGKILINRIDPMEMYWDAGAIKKNLSDARRLFRVKDVPLDEAEAMFPGLARSELHAGWADDISTKKPTQDQRDDPYYRGSNGTTDQGKTVRMVECQWWEYETLYRSVDIETGESVTFPEQKLERWHAVWEMKGFPPPQAVKQRRKVYRRATIGARILEEKEGPGEGGFSWKCMTGDRDRNAGTWYGIVRVMIDPQRLVNKLVSQALHIINSGAKGGIMAEADAFDDIRDAEENWAEPTAIVLTTPGAVSGGKIVPRPQNPMPQGMPDLLTMTISTMRDSAGINLELLGMVERDQPGILEHMRKQAGMTVLASLFDALSLYRKEQGRLLLWYITTFLSDDRLIKISGGISEQTGRLYLQKGIPPQAVKQMMEAGSAQYVPLVRNPDSVSYDVIVDETPTSPNMKERTWAILMQMMPFLSRMQLPPEALLELVKNSPLPGTLTSKLEEIAKQAQQQQQQQPNPAVLLAGAKAQSEAARAGLLQAQTEETKMNTMLGSASARAENFNNQVQALEAAQRQEEIKARVENLRSQAMLNLAKAGATQMDAYTEQLLLVLDGVDRMVNWNQTERQMQQQPRAA